MKYTWMLCAVLALCVVGCCCPKPCCPTPTSADGQEVEIAAGQVPANVLQAARTAVPGFVLEEAERETRNGVTIYDLEGTANGKEYELEITAGGRVLEVEAEDDDDDDDDGDDDDDDDDDDDK